MNKQTGNPIKLNRSQMIINLPPQNMEEIDLTMQTLGFPSRGAYLMFLHHALKASTELSDIEKEILLHLSEWGLKNFRETPDMETFARYTDYPLKNVRKTMETLESKNLLTKLSGLDGPFQFDVKIDETSRYQLTSAGRAAARAVLILSSRNTHISRK